MKLEYTAQVLRGWPADGARERAELVKQGSVLVNGDVVEIQADGTVDKVSGTASKKVGLVVRGNGDSSSALNANGTFMTPQPSKSVTAGAWAGGFVTFSVTAHGYSVGNIVTIAALTTTAANGTYVIDSVPTSGTFTVSLAADPGAITVGSGTATLQSGSSNNGKAVVLWGNYIVATSNYNTGSTFVPGSPVYGKSGKFDLANGTTDPEAGFVIRVQGVSATQTAHLVIVAY
jgi:hypothetical protein